MENTDQNLVCREFFNESRAPVWFVSMLSEVLPDLTERNEFIRVDCDPGERCFLPHAYYRIFSKSGAETKGTWFLGKELSLNGKRAVKALRALSQKVRP